MTKVEATERMNKIAKEYFAKYKSDCKDNPEAFEALNINADKLAVIATLIGRNQRSAALAAIVVLDENVRKEIPNSILRHVHYVISRYDTNNIV